MNAAMLFAAGGGGHNGPCVVEPEDGSLFPRNWLRPRFALIPGAGENLFELRLHSDNEVNDLVVYTSSTTWTMPKAMWSDLAAHAGDAPIRVTVRGATLSGNALTGPPEFGSSGTFSVAPADAPGSIVYWTTSGGTGLRGFTVGDEKVQDIARPGQLKNSCVGCHSSTPDGLFVGFSATNDPGNGDPAFIGLRSVDGKLGEPTFLSQAARALLGRVGQELPTFSKAHWTGGDMIALTMFPLTPPQGFEILWTNLETASMAQGTGWGVVKRGGDPGAAASASFSHDGKTVIYTSGSQVGAGITCTDGDVRTVPYNGGKGGASTKLAGASDAFFNEYYPVFSPDDRFVAFNRVFQGNSSYNDKEAELYVVAAAGGTPTRLKANDPPMCSGKRSPGVTNSWPKWAPEANKIGTKTYYWLTFSSTRDEMNNPQLYVAPVVIDEAGETPTVLTYPALYLWNQPAAENNHTPAWDVFQIPVQ